MSLTIFPSSLKEERFHFIPIYIDNRGHNTYLFDRITLSSINSFCIFDLSLIKEIIDYRLIIKSIICNSIKFASENLFIVHARRQFFPQPLTLAPFTLLSKICMHPLQRRTVKMLQHHFALVSTISTQNVEN